MDELHPKEIELLEAKIATEREELRQLQYKNARLEFDPAERGQFSYIGPIRESGVHLSMKELEEYASEFPGRGITLTINSQGGSVLDGFALYDYLRRLSARGHHVTTIGTGMVASMAGILLQAGDTRIMAPRCWMLVHEVQGVVSGNQSEMEDNIAFNKRLQDQALDILALHATLTRDEIIVGWKRKDWWMDASEALEHGFVDEVEKL